MSSYYNFCSDSVATVCDAYKACALPVCVDFILLNQLTEGQTYKVVISDYKGNIYTVDEQAQTGGEITITTADFPDGWFNVAAGKFMLRVYNVNDLANPVIFTFGSETYDTILIHFVKQLPIPTTAEIL